MKDNMVRAALGQGIPVFGTMIQEMRSPAVPIILANAGFDFVFLDMEHGTFNIETAADLVKVIRLVGMTPLVRVPDGQYHVIAPLLDAGAQGIMVPRVETKDQVEHVVSCAKYPPLGKRGCSVAKGHNEYQNADIHEFTEHSNRETLIIIQIERREAVDTIDKLISVPGVDVALIGPNDLALSLGVPMDLQHAELKAAISKVLESCQRGGVAAGIHAGNPAVLIEWYRRGMSMLTYSSDIEMLTTASRRGLEALRKGAME